MGGSWAWWFPRSGWSKVRSRLAAALWWILPPLVCLLAFRRGLFAWFQQDDFSWLRLEMRSWADFWRLLAEPHAQGTIRPLSERFFFIAWRRLFDLNAFPYHLLVFLTQAANLALLGAIARRLTGSQPAAAVATLAWGLNAALVSPLVWASAYNQVLCTFFYLAGFLLFLRHLDTGRRALYLWQWGAFLAGFGALETIVAYPAVIAAWCCLAARRGLGKALLMMIPAAGYAALHLWVIPRAAAGPYAVHFDSSILSTLWDYWTRVLGPQPLSHLAPAPVAAVVIALSAGLAAAFARAAGGARRVALFGLAWFVLTLAPVLPLRDHRLDYYVTIPAVGLALAIAALAGSVPRPAAIAWLAVYFGCALPVIERSTQALYRRSQAARRLLDGVSQIRERHPGKTILLAGVSDLQFYAAIYDEGLRTAGIRGAYLAPAADAISGQPGRLPVDTYRLPARVTLEALDRGKAVVYEVSGSRFENITTRYRILTAPLLKPEPLRRVNVGEPLMAGALGPGWYGIQGEHRWMGPSAEVRLAGPRSPQEKLRLETFYPEHLAPDPIRLTVSINSVAVGRAEIRDRHSGVHLFPVPASAVGLEEITVRLEAERTFRASPDPRDLGAAFGVVELVD